MRTACGCTATATAPSSSAAAPEITATSRRASRLARTHGITRLVLAEATAREKTAGKPAALRRAATLALASPGLDAGHPDTAEAAAYPETIDMAAALLSAPGALPVGPEQLAKPCPPHTAGRLQCHDTSRIFAT